MIKLIERQVQEVQLKDISSRYICDFYEKKENRKTIILIYEKDDYFTNIAYEEIIDQKLYQEKEWMYFLIYMCKGKSVYVENTGGGIRKPSSFLKINHTYFIF